MYTCDQRLRCWRTDICIKIKLNEKRIEPALAIICQQLSINLTSLYNFSLRVIICNPWYAYFTNPVKKMLDQYIFWKSGVDPNRHSEPKTSRERKIWPCNTIKIVSVVFYLVPSLGKWRGGNISRTTCTIYLLYDNAKTGIPDDNIVW